MPSILRPCSALLKIIWLPQWFKYVSGLEILQPQPPSAILPKQASIPDITPYHLHRPMPHLIHYRPFGSSSGSPDRHLFPHWLSKIARMDDRARNLFPQSARCFNIT
jgi:hypothetical protein